MYSSAYAASGVDINAGEEFVQMIKRRLEAAWPASTLGGFAGKVELPEPASAVVGCSDGSGTMAIVAVLADRLEVIGENAAAMSLVDAYVSGAMPVGLLDVIDVAKLKPKKHIAIIDGLITACRKAGQCRLVGGETAELPDMFKHPWMVNVNTSVIAVPSPDIIVGGVEPGQLVWGWRSNGPASNGFSLIRRVFGLHEQTARARKLLQQEVHELGGSLAKALLQPAPIWISQIEIQRRAGVRFAAHAHITGGGLVDNIPRVLPYDCKVVLNRSAWERPPIFDMIQRTGAIDPAEMDRVFNQGVMVVSIVSKHGSEPATPSAQPIGLVECRRGNEPQVEFTGTFSS